MSTAYVQSPGHEPDVEEAPESQVDIDPREEPPVPKQAKFSAKAPVVCVVSGHSNRDPGAVGNGVVESKLNRAVTAYIVRRLRQHKIVVAYDVEHENPGAGGEVAFSKRFNTVLFYSQHHNAAGAGKARGIETYKTGKDRSYRFARHVHAHQLAALRKLDPTWRDRGVKEARGTRAQYAVVESAGSACLSEPGFVSNPNDAKVLGSPRYVTTFGEATVEAIVEFGHVAGLWPQRYKKPTPEQRMWRVRDARGNVVGTFSFIGDATKGAGKVAQSAALKTGRATIEAT